MKLALKILGGVVLVVAIVVLVIAVLPSMSKKRDEVFTE